MAGIEITLIIIGLIFVIVSFFVQEKLSPGDIESITQLSEKELNLIVEKQLKNANAKVEDSIEQMMDEALEISERAMEKESNEKIMAISEYSNTVLDSMNKTHNEILFLYSMLGDKHNELTTLASQLQQFSDQLKHTENEVLQNLAEAAKEVEQRVAESEPVDEEAVMRASVEVEHTQDPLDGVNHNEKILLLHQQGISDVEIARNLGLGLGEVKLVIGLFKGEGYSEV
jgi:hypothetical protein